jgi:hypothetical protein
MSRMFEQRRKSRVTVATVKKADLGQFVKLEQTPNNRLRIVPDHKAISTFIEDNADHLSTDILTSINHAELQKYPGRRYNVWGDDDTLLELLESYLTNGWDWVMPEDIGALTSAPILEAPDGRVYWHERYQVESAAEELMTGNTVTFDGAPENREPKMKATEVKDEKKMPTPAVKESSRKKAADTPMDTPPPVKPMEDKPMEDKPLPPKPATNPYQGWQSEALITTIENLTDLDNFATAKPEQKAVEQMAEVLSARPVEQMTEQKAAALKKAGFGGCYTNQETGAVLEGGDGVPDTRKSVEDNTGIAYPVTELPSKLAAEMNATKAVKLCEDFADKLKALFIEAKPLTRINEARAVREAVDSIYDAMHNLGEAQKLFSKQVAEQEREEEIQASVLKERNKKSSLFGGLKLAGYVAGVEIKTAPRRAMGGLRLAGNA